MFDYLWHSKQQIPSVGDVDIVHTWAHQLDHIDSCDKDRTHSILCHASLNEGPPLFMLILQLGLRPGVHQLVDVAHCCEVGSCYHC